MQAEWPRAIEELCSYPHIEEAAVLSTCNRMELYVVAVSAQRGVREVEGTYLNLWSLVLPTPPFHLATPSLLMKLRVSLSFLHILLDFPSPIVR